jgi:hypothetical protein
MVSDADAVYEWIKSNAWDDYSGMWRDSDTGHLVIAFVGDVDHRGQLLRQVSDQASVVVVRHEYRYEELVTAQDRILESLEALRVSGVDVTGVGISDDRNRVVVSVRSLDDATEGMIQDLVEVPSVIELEVADYPRAL